MHTQKALRQLANTQRLPPGRLADIILSPGPHPTRQTGLCALEACAWLAGERHTDRPESVPPALARFIGTWDNMISPNERSRLLQPFLQEAITADPSQTAEARRNALAKDWMVRTATPIWMRAVGLHAQALPLEHLTPITDQHPQTLLHTTIMEIALQIVTGRLKRLQQCFPDPPDQRPWRSSYVPSYHTVMAAGLSAAYTAAGAPPDTERGPELRNMARECCRMAAHSIAGMALLRPAPRGAKPADPLTPPRQELNESASALLHRMATLQQPPEPQVTDQDLRAHFTRLAAQWRHATRFVSSEDMFTDPSYQQIIAMGPRALPLILEDLQETHAHWFLALQRITGHQPIPRELAGRVADMAGIWIAWAQEQGILPAPEPEAAPPE